MQCLISYRVHGHVHVCACATCIYSSSNECKSTYPNAVTLLYFFVCVCQVWQIYISIFSLKFSVINISFFIIRTTFELCLVGLIIMMEKGIAHLLQNGNTETETSHSELSQHEIIRIFGTFPSQTMHIPYIMENIKFYLPFFMIW